MTKRSLSLSLALALALHAPSSHAEAPAAALLHHLGGSATLERLHPLAEEDGRVPLLVELPDGVEARSLGLHPLPGGLASIRLAPERAERFAREHPELAIEVGPPVRPQMDRAAGWAGVGPFRTAIAASDPGAAGRGVGVVVGVVDTGIDITHPAFFDELGRSRVRWLMTWGAPRGLHPELEAQYGCTDPDQASCAIYAGEDLDALLATGAALPEDVLDAFGHGTHVASIAAGNGKTGAAEAPKYAGIAPESTLIVVSAGRGGGFSDARVIRGTQFIFEQAEALGLPAVANLSLGTDFGPHDGTSGLEKGIAALVGDDRPGRVVVTAVGNSGSLYSLDGIDTFGVHTEAHVAPHAPVRVPIALPGSTGGDVFVWIGMRPGDALRVGLDGPDGTWIAPVEPNDDAGYDDEAGTTAAIVNAVPSKLPDGTLGAIVTWSGAWEDGSIFDLVLEGRGDAQLWTTGAGGAAGRALFVRAVREGTVNSPGSHPRLLAVGCTINRHRWNALGVGTIELAGLGPDDEIRDDSPCYFSASGPTPLGVPKPEIVAPGAFVVAAMSVEADPRTKPGSMFDGRGCPDGTQCFLVDERYAISSGTSMSAPVVAGAVALMLERRPELTQARATELLQAGARWPVGAIDALPPVGPGAVDLSYALDVLADEVPATYAPSSAESFVTLASERARPDRSWPIAGTIQLRRADGSIASGLDGSLLRVVVEGPGAVVSPPVKVAHGTFTFAVAGNEGAGGQTMGVRVLYGSAPIGEALELAIAADAWLGTTTPVAVGGCGVARGADARNPSWAMGIVAAVAWARRRRRA